MLILGGLSLIPLIVIGLLVHILTSGEKYPMAVIIFTGQIRVWLIVFLISYA